MERAPLRPIPVRPSGPVSDPEAVRLVASVLPAVGAREGLALALVVLVGRERAEVAQRVGLDQAALGVALAAARKELRRTVAPLPSTGWCERAELSISDRLDASLDEAGARRLDVHLRNCPRCVEHERRLVQATDALVAGLGAPPPPVPARVKPVPVAEPESEPAPEAAAEPVVEAPEPAAPPRGLRERSVGLSWNLLFALAVLLTLASLALALAGVLGAQL